MHYVTCWAIIQRFSSTFPEALGSAQQGRKEEEGVVSKSLSIDVIQTEESMEYFFTQFFNLPSLCGFLSDDYKSFQLSTAICQTDVLHLCFYLQIKYLVHYSIKVLFFFANLRYDAYFVYVYSTDFLLYWS